jgi:1-pyrroline-5-carboxylate dehydrogenase
MPSASFKLTYATMFAPPPELHTCFEVALAQLKANLGKEHAMFINGREVLAKDKFEDRCPADTALVLGIFQSGSEQDAHAALAAARKAFPGWSHTPWQERIRLLRKAADLMDEHLFEIGAVVAMEVGKNRMEALGDVAETADLIRYACGQMEANQGYIKLMGRDPIPDYKISNTSLMRPYGVWLVISPFNFPVALTGGPLGSALAAGNTVVFKPATDTPWTSRKIAECLRDAGLPAGVFNYVTGPGRTLGQALVDSPEVDGITFTGSFDVGMKIFRDFNQRGYIKPTILELGGKNPAIVSRNADIEEAATGIVRSAFGLQGQKCSACSRVFVEKPVYQKLMARMVELTSKLTIGDPTLKDTFLGPVVNKKSFEDYQTFIKEMVDGDCRFLTGGKVRKEGEFAKGYFCEPTIVVDLPLEHHLWKDEMFVPITTVAAVDSLEEAMTLANDVSYGLTAGFYGSREEADWFFDQIQAGVTYANRKSGATTGAWPGFQPFGGWKGSGSSGKNAGGLYYLPLYMHEQIHTLFEKG